MLSGDTPGADHLDVAASLVIEGVAAPEITSWSFTRDLALRTPGLDTASPTAGEGEVWLAPAAVAVTGSASPWRTGEDASPSPSASGVLTLALSPDHAWPVATCRVDAPSGSMWDGATSVKVIDPVDSLAVPLRWEPMHAKMPPVGYGGPFRWAGLTNAYVVDRAARDAGWHATPPASPLARLHVPMCGSLWPRAGVLIETPTSYPTFSARDSMPQAACVAGAASATYQVTSPAGLGNFEVSMEVDPVNLTAGSVSWDLVDSASGDGKGYRFRFDQGDRRFSVNRLTRSGGVNTPGVELAALVLTASDTRVSVRHFRFQNTAGDEREVRVRSLTGAQAASSTLAGGFTLDEGASAWRAYLTATGGAVTGAFLVDDPAVSWATLAWVPNVVHGFTFGSVVALRATPRMMGEVTALDVIRDQAAAEFSAWGWDETGRLTYRTRQWLTSRPVARTLTAADLVDFSWVHETTGARSSVTVTHKVPATIQRSYPSVTVWQGSGDTLDAGESGTIVMAPDNVTDWLKIDGTFDQAGVADMTDWNRGYGSWWGASRVRADDTDQWAYGLGATYITASVTQINDTTWALDYSVASSMGGGATVEMRIPESSTARRKGAPLPVLRASGVTRWLDREMTTTAGPARAPRLEHDAGWHVQDGAALPALLDWVAGRVATPRPRMTGIRIKPDPRLQVGDKVRVLDDRPGGTGADLTGLITRKQLSGAPGEVSMIIDVTEL